MFRRIPLLAAAAALLALCLLLPFLIRRTDSTRLAESKALPASSAEVVTPEAPAAPEATPREPEDDDDTPPAAAFALAPRQSELWARAVPEAGFAEFKMWTEHWQARTAATAAALEEEGVALATNRRRLLADKIMNNPQRALELAVPVPVRRTLPAAVESLLEERVNTRADYRVVAATHPQGADRHLPLMARSTTFEGEIVEIFPSGEALNWRTHENLALHGIMLPATATTNPPEPSLVEADKIMALSPEPETLEAEETEEAIKQAGGVPGHFAAASSPDQAGLSSSTVALRIGGETRLLCCATHAASALGSPVNRLALAVAGGPVQGVDPQEIESLYTQGTKRYLFLRVDFSDYEGEQATISEQRAGELLQEMQAEFRRMSYGTFTLAPMNPTGSAVSPILRASKEGAEYDHRGLDVLYWEALDLARNAGVNVDGYDFIGLYTTDKPLAGYGGLGYVGIKGLHIAGARHFDMVTTVHEMGHNFGLDHARALFPHGRATLVGGELVEYGNPYDTMGDRYEISQGHDYMGSHKRLIKWLPSGDSGRVSNSGIYRLFAVDDINSRGRRTLRFDGGEQPYYLDFRSGMTSDFLNSSVLLQQADASGDDNTLFDVFPGLDHWALPIGRTFSDPTADGGDGVHITPVRKGGTFPESLDVQITFGPVAANQPPIVRVTADATTIPAGGAVGFSATASDPNNDELAYSWHLGDGVFSLDNQPEQSATFFTPGRYTVECLVSDMKGGTARGTVVVDVVGNGGTVPRPLQITGRVVDLEQKPAAGIYVTATHLDSGQQSSTWSQSDGSYIIPNLADGNYTISALDDLLDTLNYARFHTSPVEIGPDSGSGIDLVVSASPRFSLTPELIARRAANWRYFATGEEPAEVWREVAFDDADWVEGGAVFGYGPGNGSVETTISYGDERNNKWPAYYFRKKFTIQDPAQVPGLRLEVMRNDGVVVYLNGVEIFRDNISDEAPTSETYADLPLNPLPYIVYDIKTEDLPEGLLLAGDNVLAAETHIASPAVGNMSFDAALRVRTELEGEGDRLVYVASPVSGEVLTAPVASRTIEAVVKTRVPTLTVTKVEFFAGNTKLGEDDSAPYTFEWASPAVGEYVLRAEVTFSDNNKAVSGSNPVSVVAAPATLLAADAVWRYRSQTSAAPEGWELPGFDDSAWFEGPAQLGYGDEDEATTIISGTPGDRPITSYFRTAFNVTDPQALTSVIARLIRDDGAALYLNGVEFYRSNLPDGALAYDTRAADAGPASIENSVFTFSVPPSLLVAGRNVLAAEVHQSSVATSDDLSFACWLEATGAAPRAPLLAIATADTALPETPRITADVVVGEGLQIAKLEFFAGAAKIGEITSAPYEFVWNAATPGTHVITATATDSAGGALASNEVSLEVAAPRLGTVLIPFASEWRYHDEYEVATRWRQVSYSDTSWSTGVGKLGYGNDGEATLLQFGPDPEARNVTAWFRKKFPGADAAGFSALRLRLLADDGAVVYLNEKEIFRFNMPEGEITPFTLAASAISGAAESQVVDVILPKTELVAGENLLAVEVHQAAGDSSDLGFDLELTGLQPGGEGFYLTKPYGGETVSARAPMEFNSFSVAGATKVEYYAGSLKVAESTTGPYYEATWDVPLVGAYPVEAVATLPDGSTLLSGKLTITVSGLYLPEVVFGTGSEWKYWDPGTLPAANWREVDFDDTWLRTGASRFGFGNDGEVTTLAPGVITYYFRKSFEIENIDSYERLVFNYQRDDGVVVYLNGVELFRDNLPSSGQMLPSTRAREDVSGSREQRWYTHLIDRSRLRNGRNVITAELHQFNVASEDAGWDAEFVAYSASAITQAGIAPHLMPELSLQAGGTGSATDPWELALEDPVNGRLYYLETSDDLTLWEEIGYDFVEDGRISLTLPRDPEAPQRYYRATWKPGVPVEE